jgi:hypothetical protein
MRRQTGPFRMLVATLVAAAALVVPSQRIGAQEQDSTDEPRNGVPVQFRAIIPAFHNRLGNPGTLSAIQLRRQSFVVFVYRNAVAVCSQAEFVNGGTDTVEQEFALPSTGHDRNDEDSAMASNGILSPRIVVEGERIAAEVVEDGDGTWYAIRSTLGPGETRKFGAEFWAQTSLADVDSLPGLDSTVIAPGRRGFLLDISHAGSWNDVIDSIGVRLVLRGGLEFERDSFEVSPENFDYTDSTIEWWFESTEPTADDDIYVDYRPAKPWPAGPNTMAHLSAFIVSRGYDELLEYVRRLDDE